MKLLKQISKFLTLLSLSTILIFCNSCKKEESTPDDEFYIKYKFEMRTLAGRTENIIIDYNEEDGQNRQTETKGDFETTIGPVSKGFQASLSPKDKNPLQFEYHLKLNLKIFVSKNNSPFAEKAVNESSDPRTSASLIYTVK